MHGRRALSRARLPCMKGNGIRDRISIMPTDSVHRPETIGGRPLSGRSVPQRTGAAHRAPPRPFGRYRSFHDYRTEQTAEQEDGCHRKDGVEFGESGEDKRITHHVVPVTDGCYTVGAYLPLTYGAQQADQADQQPHAQNGGGLKNGDTGRQVVLHEEEADETVQALRTGKRGKYHVTAERPLVLLHRPDGGVRRIGDAERTSDTRQGHHERYADVSNINWFHNVFVFSLIIISLQLFFRFPERRELPLRTFKTGVLVELHEGQTHRMYESAER